jgi:hypothetical protein
MIVVRSWKSLFFILKNKDKDITRKGKSKTAI